jgi:hypothetical protein
MVRYNVMIRGLTYLKDQVGTRAKGRSAAAVDSGYIEGWGNPVWRDEFDYIDPATLQPAVDPLKWNVRSRSDLGLLFDAAEPDAGQVSVDSNQILHLKGTWLPTPYNKPSGYTGVPVVTHKTGYIDQRSLQAGDVVRTQQYGRWEIRAKMPTGPQSYGALSAFWLRNSASGEIDIVESWGHNTTPTSAAQLPGSSTLTIHSHTAGSSAAGYQKKFWRVNEQLNDYSDMAWSYISKNLPLTPAYNTFRTWAFEYTPTYLAAYYEGRRYAYTTPAETPWLWDPSYFGQPFHIRLNLHVGPSATYWGLPDPANREWTQDPLDYQVEYVRVYAHVG